MTLATWPRERLELARSLTGPRYVNAQQKAFYRSQAPEVLYSGAFRAGKSRIGCEKAYWLAKRYPGIPIGICIGHTACIGATACRRLELPVLRGARARQLQLASFGISVEDVLVIAGAPQESELEQQPAPESLIPFHVADVGLGRPQIAGDHVGVCNRRCEWRAMASQRSRNARLAWSRSQMRESGDHTPVAFDERTSGGSSRQ